MPNDSANTTSPSTLTPATNPAAPTTTPQPTAPAATPEPAATAPAPASSLLGGAVEPPIGEVTGSASPITLEDITLPEGFTMPEAEGAEFLELLNNAPESRAEFATRLLEVHNKILQGVADQHATAWNELQQSWQDQIRAMPEFAGDKLQGSMSKIAKVLDRYGDKEVREAFALTGAGNHPAIAKFLLKIANDYNEGPVVRGAPANSPAQDRASRMFGTK